MARPSTGSPNPLVLARPTSFGGSLKYGLVSGKSASAQDVRVVLEVYQELKDNILQFRFPGAQPKNGPCLFPVPRHFVFTAAPPCPASEPRQSWAGRRIAPPESCTGHRIALVNPVANAGLLPLNPVPNTGLPRSPRKLPDSRRSVTRRARARTISAARS